MGRVADMVGLKVLPMLLLAVMCRSLHSLPLTLSSSDDNTDTSYTAPANWFLYRSGLSKRQVKDASDTDANNENNNIPWDMMMYNPMMRGKKNKVMNTAGLPCMMRSRVNNICTMNMVLRDRNSGLHKIL